MIAANDPQNDEALPAQRCSNCAHWCLSMRGSGMLGECMVRPGALRTYSAPANACDVNAGRAWVLLRERA